MEVGSQWAVLELLGCTFCGVSSTVGPSYPSSAAAELVGEAVGEEELSDWLFSLEN